MVRVDLCLDPALIPGDRTSGVFAGADFVVLPELADGGYAALKAGAAPHRPGDALLSRLASLSLSTASTCIAGSLAYSDRSTNVTNTSLVFSRGRRIHRYDKIHLFRPGRDHIYFSPGTTIGTFSARASGVRLRCGVVICYDLRFPELIRAMAKEGMRLLFVPARWPAARDIAWQTLLRARAIENQIFVVGCNALGSEGGPSAVYGPGGELLFSDKKTRARRHHSVILDLTLLEKARRFHRNIDEAVVLRRSRIPARLRRL